MARENANDFGDAEESELGYLEARVVLAGCE